MDYNFVANIKSCYTDIPQILYYSHIPVVILAVIIGFFVFIKNRESIAGKVLFLLTISFSAWSFFDLVTWLGHSSQIIMISWILIYLFEALVFVFSLYFAYSFVSKKDLPFFAKIIVGSFFLPIVFLMPSTFSAEFFSITTCEAMQGDLILYLYFFEGFFFLWTLIFLIKSFVKAERENKRQILLLTVGVTLFLAAFSWANIAGNIMTNWEITQYGLFGMPVFLAFLAYLIVRYKAFNIKLIAAQALVVSLVLLIGSQFAFIQNNTNRVLTGITLALSIGFGYMLIKSVKQEIKRKEELQLMADKLAIANDKLRQLDQDKTDFINIESHQLKHAPTPIKGYLSMLLEGSYGEVPEKMVDVLEKINAANERQIHLVDDLLAVARMESGKVQLDFQKVHIEEICQGVYDNLAVTATEKNLTFKFEKPSELLPELMLDKSKMFEAIFNFVDNAVKYTPSGSVTLKTELAETSNYKPRKDSSNQPPEIDGPVVRVTVADTGAGISDEHIGHLFAKFSRADAAKNNNDGTGLGLYVVKLMIEAHGGRTWAQSEGEGKGSQFIIEIPVKHVA